MRFAAFLFLALLFPVLAFAGPIEDAKAAMDRPDYHAAFEILQPLAEVGNSEAEFWVGVLYQDGQMDIHGQWTMKRDYAKAARWYRKAADQGHAEAQDSLSRMYERGEGVPKDLSEAYFWNRLAAMAGYKDSIDESGAIAKNLPPEQRASVERRVKEWKPTAAPAAVPDKP